jgi:endonuclease/exonuclease/phosphatase family metal-dependent hydrolase
MRLSLCLLIATLAACAPRARPAQLPNEGATVLGVATFNLHHETFADVETVELVGETGADVVFLQEVSPAWQRVLMARYAVEFPHQLYRAAGGAGGLGVLSRWPLEDMNFLAPAVKHPAWLVSVRTPGGDLPALNVHLRASRRPGQGLIDGLLTQSDDHRREIEAFVDACSVEPWLVAGDFNEGPEGSAVTWLERRGMLNALPRYRPGQATWRALGNLLTLTLDHVVAARDRLHVLDAWVLRGGNSDHWPVLVRLALEERRA